MLKKTIIATAVAAQLTACATATRGTTTLLVVNTSPAGAKVITSSETKQSKKISPSARKKALKDGTYEELGIEYRGCNPTPCGVEIPRKAQFDILVTKDGYISQTEFIDKIHRKDVVKKNAVKTVGTAAVAGGGTAAVAGISGATVLGSSVVAPLALTAAVPIIAVGGVSLMVDSASGANYDLTPNPVDMTLVVLPENSQGTEDLVANEFIKHRKQIAMDSLKTPPKKPKVKMCRVSDLKTIPCEEYYAKKDKS